PEGFKNISPPEGLNQQGVCENYVYNKNDVIPSRFSGEGPCVWPWSFMELRNARSLGQSPRDHDLQFSHTLLSAGAFNPIHVVNRTSSLVRRAVLCWRRCHTHRRVERRRFVEVKQIFEGVGMLVAFG